MLTQPADTLPSEEWRREIFAALIDAQDLRSSPHQARKDVARQFGLTFAQVAAIEQEGIDADWPPL